MAALYTLLATFGLASLWIAIGGIAAGLVWIFSRKLAWSDERPPMGDWPFVHQEMVVNEAGGEIDTGGMGGTSATCLVTRTHDIARHGECQ